MWRRRNEIYWIIIDPWYYWDLLSTNAVRTLRKKFRLLKLNCLMRWDTGGNKLNVNVKRQTFTWSLFIIYILIYILICPVQEDISKDAYHARFFFFMHSYTWGQRTHKQVISKIKFEREQNNCLKIIPSTSSYLKYYIQFMSSNFKRNFSWRMDGIISIGYAMVVSCTCLWHCLFCFHIPQISLTHKLDLTRKQSNQ